MLKAHKILEEIAALQLELRRHQDRCTHKRKTKTYGASTGNWCEADDCYWTNFECPTCLKRWMEDGSK